MPEPDDIDVTESVPEIEQGFRESGLPPSNRKKPKEPAYQVFGGQAARVIVPKAAGKLWKNRVLQGKRALESRGVYTAWREAAAYYRNNQHNHRQETGGDAAGNSRIVRRIGDKFSETENVVFSTVNAVLPFLAAKNPSVEITAEDPEDERQANVFERLANVITARKGPPGINLKPKLRKTIINASLRNCGWIEIGYNKKDPSSDDVTQQLNDLAEELQKAKDTKTIEELEGKISGILERFEYTDPPGPFVRRRAAEAVVVDPEAENEDASDANWIAIEDYIPTSQLRAQFGKKTSDGEWKSIYKPTHVLRVNAAEDIDKETDDEVNFSLFESGQGHSEHGYEDEETFAKAQRTKVWKIWDKRARRIYMYNDKDWTWPIWVWNDPYHLDRFFPLYRLYFTVDPDEPFSWGEVSYYLDQQDAINEMLSEKRQARWWVRKNIGYNSNILSKDAMDRMMSGDTDKAVPFDLPEGTKMSDHVFGMPTPSISFFDQLFNPSSQYEAIERLTGAGQIIRGGEFKTNTTNGAIEQYRASASTRLDDKTDAIEDFIGDVLSGVLQLCVQFMDKETVISLIGEKQGGTWENMEVAEFMTQYSMRIVGGSTAKPTSAAKKDEAVNVGQVLGQFANVTPTAVIVALQVLERAFDEIVISPEEWEEIRESLVKATAQPPQGPGQAQGQGQGQPSPQDGGGGGDINQIFQQIAEQIDKLPPEAKRAIAVALTEGVPFQEAIGSVMNAMSGRRAA